VVLDVARGKLVRVLALELEEEIRRHLPEHVHQDVQTTAVRHAQNDLLHPVGARALDQLVDRRDQALAALQREALLPHVAGVQIALEVLGLGELLQQAPLLVVNKLRGGPGRLDPLLDPLALGPVGDEHVLEADVAAVGVAQRLQQRPQGDTV
jgi:hypothetical protein